MATHLVKWDKKYRRHGLTIIDIDNGMIDAKKDLAEHVKKKKYTFPVIWDEQAKISRRYGVSVYPTAVLIGADGKVVWHGIPISQVSRLEKLVTSELKKIKHKKKIARSPTP